MTQMGMTCFWNLTQLLELGLTWLPLQWPIRLQTMTLASTHIHSRRKCEPLDPILRKHGKGIQINMQQCFYQVRNLMHGFGYSKDPKHTLPKKETEKNRFGYRAR